ncbi:hypothetical protein N0V90_010009 [Kalmusia sp. IMI 367209]|nr:hypothetical protein N0V90_010009 [Kalmusia sp. IMI 367209]
MFCSGQSHRRLLELHDKYGCIVRIGPNELSYTVPEAWESIMGRRKGSVENPKAPWYCPAENKEITGAPYSDHVRMRRLLASGFSASAMQKQQPIIKSHINLLIERLRERSQNGKTAINVPQWYNYCLFDIIGDLSFGEPFGCLQESTMHPWIAWIFANVRLIAIGLALNRFPLLRVVLPWLAPKSLRNQAEDLKRVSREKVAKRLEAGRDRPDFIQAMISGKGEVTLTREEIENNAMVLTIAGSETTATALTGATYFLAKTPSAMAKVASEVRSTFKQEADIDFLSVTKLPYLKAVTEETLRMYPPGPNAQPRITPPEGSLILGDHIPGNTVIGIPQRAMFLSESNFTRAREFIPERWLNDPVFSTDRKDCFNPFSVGPRNCIGMNLAYAEFRTILARMVWNFDFEISDSSRNWMEEQNSYLLWDKIPLYIHLVPGTRREVQST